jgi:outer membrane lipoprotein LolB
MFGCRRMFGGGLSRANCALGLALLLAGCAGVTPTQRSPAQLGAPLRAYQETIDLGGRLSVRYQKSGKEEVLHGSFSWSQTPQRTLVLMQSLLGQSIASIEITPGNASLTLAGQAPRSTADVDTLTAETLGWPLPVSGLRDWLQGFAVDRDGQRVIAMPQAAATAVATPDGWQLHFVSWAGDDPALPSRPKRIDLERSTEQAGDVAIRIVIDTWQPH